MIMMKTRLLIVAGISLSMLSCSSGSKKADAAAAAPAPAFDGSVLSKGQSRYHPTVGTKGIVVADDRIAAEWGAQILREGGNAVDAAVATAFAMAVTRPQHSSIGGGGFMVFCPKPEGGKPRPCQTIDYREEAPSKATRDMFIRNGKADSKLSLEGALASGVPGTTAGLMLALEKFGTQPRAKLLRRPIELARRGVPWTANLEQVGTENWKILSLEAKRIFGCKLPKTAPNPLEKQIKRDVTDGGTEIPGVGPCPIGSMIKQPDLARTLEAISARGAKGFYEGKVAETIAKGFEKAGGLITERDLAAYRPQLRAPVSGKFEKLGGGVEVISMPPPSAGGALVVQMLGYMERADKQGALAGGYGSASSIHAMAHAMQLAYADRSKYFGDPDHVPVPVAEMLAPGYLDARWATFKPSKVNAPSDAGDVSREGQHTTHFVVMDREGNAVAATHTINTNFGSGFVPPGTGVVMNNEMDDFAAQPGVPNYFGLMGTEANSVAPRKRPLSSMSPTIVRDLRTGEVRLAVGAAGGSTITTTVFEVIMNRLRFGMSIDDAMTVARFHHQWKPAELKLETQGFGADTRARLSEIGYPIKDTPALARAHAAERFPSNGRVWGVPDPRGEGAAVVE